MEALYAHPDHEVVARLLPSITERHCAPGEAVARMHDVPGLVPVAIDHRGGGRIYLADLGDRPYREWQHMYTIADLAEADAVGERFTTDFDLLLRDDLPGDTVDPEGLVFHISRCGSTLVSKALARMDATHMITQGAPLQRGFWATLTGDFESPLNATPDALHAFRNIVRLMARDRGLGVERSFVKFISWNILYIDFVQQAWPDLPALFMYRDPVEVIASVLRETTAVLTVRDHRQAEFLTGLPMERIKALDDTGYLARCFARYFETALDAPSARLSVLNYADLTPDRFEDIVRRGLGLRPTPGEVAHMREQFRYHSKDDKQQTRFQADSAEKRAEMPERSRALIQRECAGLLAQLDRSPQNLFPKPAENEKAGLS